ncbi:hypothetical protein [Rhizobium freirei]|uniref:hypothetical protein n=1 Tax=Rhizobium freirei TaxID=1353277 RepID=UPI000560FD91|nr:hypothetical protein [Rhizobium freirei]
MKGEVRRGKTFAIVARFFHLDEQERQLGDLRLRSALGRHPPAGTPANARETPPIAIDAVLL